MTTSLCETFRYLAFSTHDHLAKARRLGHQPLEETLTDINILELKDRHPREVYSHTFNKREEGVNGADWEWWLTNSAKNKWLGLRVQAKVLHLKNGTYEHLHYRSGTPRRYQLDKLKAESSADGLIPLYCFYNHIPLENEFDVSACRTFSNVRESFGCSITSISRIEALRTASDKNSLNAVLVNSTPWHCLVCCHGYGGDDLPTRVLLYLNRVFDVSEETTDEPTNNQPPTPSIRRAPPRYVYEAMEGLEPKEPPPTDTQGIVVLAPEVDG